jgi:hypothetical protein
MKNPSLKILLSCILALSLTASATSKEVFETSSIQEWNQGSFSGTSATRNANSGNLGLGYRNGTTSDSLVGYWRLDSSVSGSGGTVKDYSGNNNDGTTKNGVTTGAEGIFSTSSFSFDGSDDYVEVQDNSDLYISDQLTISFWAVQPNDDEWELVVGNGGGWDDNGYHVMSHDSSQAGGYRFEVQNTGTGNKDVLDSNAVPNDEWHHITAVYTGTELKLYVDGSLDTSMSATVDSIGDSSANLGIGYGLYSSYGGTYFDGDIDEVRLYERALSAEEIEQLYLRGKPFHGNYTRTVNSGQNQEWDELEVGSSIPSGTEASAVFRSVDSDGTVLGEEKVSLQNGFKNYSLDVPSSEDFEISFEGNSSDPTESWSVSNFSVYTSGFCDYRGPENECVVNGSNTLDSRKYDISSIFISEESALLESLDGEAVLNATNETQISGTWRGVFSIKAQKPVIKPGATFRPENGDIVIGE